MKSAEERMPFHACDEGVGEEKDVGLDIVDGISCEGVAWVQDGTTVMAGIGGTDNVVCANPRNANRVNRNRYVDSRGIMVKPDQVIRSVDGVPLCFLSSTMLGRQCSG